MGAKYGTCKVVRGYLSGRKVRAYGPAKGTEEYEEEAVKPKKIRFAPLPVWVEEEKHK